MGLGSTAKKIQRLSTLAEKLYAKVNEVLERLSALHDRVETAASDVESVRREQREQRAILEAIAEESGVDVASVIEAADLEPDAADPEPEAVADAEGSADAEESGDAGESAPAGESPNAGEADAGEEAADDEGSPDGTEAPADAS